MMTGVITADIIQSRSKPDKFIWLDPLQQLLCLFGQEGRQWEIFRGDSLQLVIENPAEIISAALLLKATLIAIPPLDIRMGLGVGEARLSNDGFPAHQGSAFENSGHAFDLLQEKKTSLYFKSDNAGMDHHMNATLPLLLIAIDDWTVQSAVLIKHRLLEPGKSQAALGQALGIKQNTVSEHLTRAHFKEIMGFEAYFQELISRL